jgi:ATP-dependent DNA helicase RecG
MSTLSQLKTVGEKTEKTLRKLGLETILDLVFYFPYRYEKYESCKTLDNIKMNEPCIIQGKIDLLDNKKSFRKKMFITEALVSDDSGALPIIWFNQPFIGKTLKVGDEISLAGKIVNNYGRPIMISPVYEKINLNKEKIHTKNIVPVYSLTSNITQKQLRFLINQALEKIKEVPEFLPAETLKRQKLLDINTAIRKIHFPENERDIEQAIGRFKFSELFAFQLKSYLLKQKIEQKIALPLPIKLDAIKKFIASLPFKLTNDQKKSAWKILQDGEKRVPMSRLLQGDVGSGKTIVAFITLLNCAKNKKQGALMAPTEILAKQHYDNALKLFSKLNFKIGFISSKNQLANFPLTSAKKDRAQEITEQADIIIGTHSLIQEKINFKKLGLIIIDEQHRFGVQQRQEIINKNNDDDNSKTTPHFLSMTATPIPRSLALASFYGLNFSIISEKPKNRQEIKTKIITPDQKKEMYKFIAQEISAGRQAFIVCPLIDPSDKLGTKSVKDEYLKLKKDIFPEIEIAMLHGKMKSNEKEEIMQKFLNQEIKILISTSVIEVGVDVPNATVMLIEGAERFGLAQLHQFRGRVGRSDLASYCFLSISENNSDNPLLPTKENYNPTISRLEALQKHQDGLELAKIDLKNRGSGNFYGTAQSGIMSFRFASIFDSDIIYQVDQEIKKLTEFNPDLKNYPLLLKKIEKNLEEAHLE